MSLWWIDNEFLFFIVLFNEFVGIDMINLDKLGKSEFFGSDVGFCGSGVVVIKFVFFFFKGIEDFVLY